jgi:hypothetical protein
MLLVLVASCSKLPADWCEEALLPIVCCWCQGADAALSGLVAMLGALQVLHSSASNTTGAKYSSYNKRIIFLALAGEEQRS